MKIAIFAMYTPWETLENFWFTLPHFTLCRCIYCQFSGNQPVECRVQTYELMIHLR